MPRHVDPAVRRQQVAEALWRVVVRDGLERATVRAVAAEAGLSLGAVSHYFSSQEELRLYALDLVNERDNARLSAIPQEGTAREIVERYLWALLPMDQETRETTQVFYAFMVQARTDPAFREVTAEINQEVVALCRSGIELLAAHGQVAPGHDHETLVAEFRTLTEGLSFQAAMWPDTTTPESIRAVVRRWLDSLATPPVT
ncbi:TetR/AcrR family transcriptional regulator [Streptomyces johnsoniae]|uniref:TetR family transcriptional regulator C-terminal domain-containing protein n=1 Tax=Streptomyces johnsoniae TaxID=3075532 RepID=A0ABU2SHD7_9ACTN|nr:TetR family transcriptional regulator C-terminal domain-containing protein [Streptomyces sp. DSM 41886]MDT0447284.1 TetR family transcriptional regulator C-terminal domain-containing protein [Streptomyces sp. DSM 41886]